MPSSLAFKMRALKRNMSLWARFLAECNSVGKTFSRICSNYVFRTIFGVFRPSTVSESESHELSTTPIKKLNSCRYDDQPAGYLMSKDGGI